MDEFVGVAGMKEYIMETADTGMVTNIKQELIRCKDCEHGRETCGNIECDGNYHGYNWFCADGRRKEGR